MSLACTTNRRGTFLTIKISSFGNEKFVEPSLKIDAVVSCQQYYAFHILTLIVVHDFTQSCHFSCATYFVQSFRVPINHVPEGAGVIAGWASGLWVSKLRYYCIAGTSTGINWHGPGPWFNIKMSSHQYRKSHCGDKTVVRSSYPHNGISYTGKMTSLYWIRSLVVISMDDEMWHVGVFCIRISIPL